MNEPLATTLLDDEETVKRVCVLLAEGMRAADHIRDVMAALFAQQAIEGGRFEEAQVLTDRWISEANKFRLALGEFVRPFDIDTKEKT